ncbi:MAG TPA: hypothetical protein VES88_18800 [Gemmatimonadaceae bacterium]|nr:hypothetical protein [Gemmatimonadaceae bacterium]
MRDSQQIPRPSGRWRFAEGRHLDAAGYVSLVGAKLMTTLYRRMLCLVYPLQGRRIPVYNAQLEVEFRLLQADEIDAYLSFRPNVGRARIERRLEQGHRCFASWHGEKIIDAGWTATQSVVVPYLGRVLCLDQGDVYSYDAYTLPEYRGYGLYMARNSFTARTNQREGFKRSIALVAPENYAAWVILTRSGLETIGKYSYLRVPFRGIYWQRAVPGKTLLQLGSLASATDESSSTQSPGAAA